MKDIPFNNINLYDDINLLIQGMKQKQILLQDDILNYK